MPNRQIAVNVNFAYLALDNTCAMREFCHMDKSTPNRIREFREEAEMTIEELAEATGLSVSYVSRLEKGERNLSLRNLNLFAHALDKRPHDLLLEDRSDDRNVVAVMGRIAAGAEISPDEEQVPPEGLYEIETPFPIPDDAIAFEVSGESMWPRYDPGDIIICWRQSVIPEEVVGWEAAVKTSDGSRYLKRVLRGSTQGTYDLESHNAAPIRGVSLLWVAAIQSVIRSGQWRKMNSSQRHSMVRKMMNAR
ncbi:LexA family transcriptional regulator [uncultured Nitratireductor sp.]|uniref:LexA family transcriptional regulator n=1 Tax=uncultured Nitratireductor sp. TaxID=520953 RepID=UPI002602E4C1|nr:LexA family transcriptional regulator [uncultured Nitratireductor sp.]